MTRPSDSPTPSNPQRHQLHGLHKDGDEIPVEIALNPIKMDGESFILSSITDIRERKKVESLIGLADRMTAVGTLAAGVAHGINNPLAYVKGNVQFVRSELAQILDEKSGAEEAEVTRDVRLALDQAIEGADRIRDMVGDLLTYARHDNHDPKAGSDVHAVLDSVTQMTANELRHRARVEKFYGAIPAVAGEPSRLAHAFTNLLVNAAHALSEGKASENCVRITTSTEPETGRAVVEIEDTGCGMSADTLSRVFDPFFTTKPVGAGVGLGLCVTHGIITGLGGTIEIQSEPDVGTRVRVALPAGTTSIQASTSKPLPRHAGRLRVLIIDDEVRVLEMLERMLRRYEVTTASGGREALEWIASGQRYDVILCDLMMPDMTGTQLYSALRTAHPDQADHVVFLTGGAFTVSSQTFLESVPNPVLQKPIDEEKLEHAIATLA